jgi:methyltransferase-like protein
LELGAGDGAHLIPLALEAPESEYLGVDLAAAAVARGQARIEALGLRNVRLVQGDVATFRQRAEFDYVVSHGVFSWVAADVQEGLLDTVKRHLAPRGLAYVSYATYPGCHLREMARNLMLFHTSRLPQTTDAVKEGMRFVRYVMEHQFGGSAYGAALAQELERMQEHPLGYAFHDDLAEHNQPVYFGEFVERARIHELEFFGESVFGYFEDPRLAPETRATLKLLGGGDLVSFEQYLDFLRGRAFRQTLLCHPGLQPRGDYELERLLPLWAATSIKLVPPREGDEPARETFVSAAGTRISAESPYVKAALHALAGAWPEALCVAALVEHVVSSIGGDGEAVTQGRTAVLETLIRAAAIKMIELDLSPPDVAARVSERPLGSPLARAEAQQHRLVTNLWHKRLELEDDAARHLLTLLDGTRDHRALLTAMRDYFARQSGAQVPSRQQLEEQLEKVLSGMVRHALLLP